MCQYVIAEMLTGDSHRRRSQETLAGYAYRSCNSPGTKRNHNLLITNALEITGLPGDTDLASPAKLLFVIMLIIRWLQIRGLPGDLHETILEARGGVFGIGKAFLIPGGYAGPPSGDASEMRLTLQGKPPC